MFRTAFAPLLLLLALCLVSFTTPGPAGPAPRPIKWTIQKTSTLRVAGKSNVNEFTCDLTGYYQQDTLCVADNATGRPVRLSGSLEVDVFRFDCHSRLITGDLRKTLKAEEHPRLKIRFLTLEQLPVAGLAAFNTKGLVEVELAGVRKTFEIRYDFQKSGPATFQLNGARTFSFSDFKLTPPRKLGGVIRIEDQFDVDFQLILKPC
ncbi:hypothetical protein V9K67_15935 [Paraflavisolibacter sp. H34]|uniref:hypothetical protein n=1 Tax=Huijunlia imazamoxiresistens TaxID=3127457 RepID=UPI003016A637